MSANYSRCRKQTFQYLSDLSSIKVLTKDNRCQRMLSPEQNPFAKHQRFSNLPPSTSWPLSLLKEIKDLQIWPRGHLVSRGSITASQTWVCFWAHWPATLCPWWAQITKTRMTKVTLRHRLGLGWLRHLSLIVVKCIRLTFGRSNWLHKSLTQPPLKIISHKILVGEGGMDGQPYLRRLLGAYTYAGLTPHPTYYAVVCEGGSQYCPPQMDTCHIRRLVGALRLCWARSTG